MENRVAGKTRGEPGTDGTFSVKWRTWPESELLERLVDLDIALEDFGQKSKRSIPFSSAFPWEKGSARCRALLRVVPGNQLHVQGHADRIGIAHQSFHIDVFRFAF